jgi:hypothetical protein
MITVAKNQQLSFRDSEGRTWKLKMTLGVARRVADELGIDLLDLTSAQKDGEPLMTRLGVDLSLLVDVLYLMVKPQADQQGVDSETFGESLDGDTIAEARTAFWEALSDFFRRLRPGTAKAIEKQEALTRKAIELEGQNIDQIDIDAVVRDLTAKRPRLPSAAKRTASAGGGSRKQPQAKAAGAPSGDSQASSG